MKTRKIETITGKALPFPISIALDGPAASGKSTTAKRIADQLGILYIDTGAMYRALTYKIQQNKIDINDQSTLKNILKKTHIDLQYTNRALTVMLDNKDVSDIIRTPEVSSFVSEVSAVPVVRYHLVEIQRKIASGTDSILDGRDIGTIVLPDAYLKIFMICGLEKRAERRLSELSQKGIKITLEEVIQDIKKRDKIDSSRSVGPLKKADDAIEIDTSDLTIQQQTDKVVQYLRSQK